MNNIYFDNNKPTQSLIELLDYIGLTLDDFKALSKEELQGIIAKLKKPLDVGRETKATPNARHNRADLNKIFTGTINTSFGHADQGDLSRYFSLDAWTKKNLPELYKISKKTLELQEDAEKISPFLFTSKADKGSKNAGLEGCKGTTKQQNTHPTGKSIALYSYLCNLFTQPHDLVLDPYCGSGTTPIACVLTNRHYIGLELEKEYFDIAEARVRYWQEQKEWQANKTSKEEGTLI
jgi:DNA modification methylase